MADFGEFDNPAFDSAHDFDDFDDPLVNPPPVQPEGQGVDVTDPGAASVSTGARVRQELLQSAVDDYYNALAEQGVIPALGRDTTKFELVDGRLRLKEFPDIRIINTRTLKPLSLNTVSHGYGGAKAIREGLGFVDWTRGETRLPAEAVTALQAVDRKLGEAAAAISSANVAVELQDLGQTSKEASDAVGRVKDIMETALTDADGPMTPPFSLRELQGLDKALRTIRGELTNNLAKLSELDEHIEVEKRKLEAEGLDEDSRRRIAERLRGLQDERASRLEAAAANRGALRSQISRIRETIHSILNEDTTLAERIRTLFREQGVTIASILTAIGLAISTLVLALTGGGSGGTPPTPPPSDKGGVREWVKKHLESLGRALAKLAGKAAAALPGIIGSIVSWLLGTLGKVTSWAANNLWAVVMAVGGLLFVAAREWVAS